MEKSNIKAPQLDGLKNFLVQLPYHFTGDEISRLSSSLEFRRMAHAIKFCESQRGRGNPSQAAEKYNYSCIARNICPTVSKQFIQCWRQAQTNPNLTCDIQRRRVETCVGEHVSQAIYTVDAGSITADCFKDEDTQGSF